MAATGATAWVGAEACTPSRSGGQVFGSRKTSCMPNAGSPEVRLSVVTCYAGRAPAGACRVHVPAERASHPAPVPRGTGEVTGVEADRAVPPHRRPETHARPGTLACPAR